MTDVLTVPCPQCAKAVPVLAVIRNLTICPSCLMCLALDVATVRLANAMDTTVLPPNELATLKAARKVARKALV